MLSSLAEKNVPDCELRAAFQRQKRLDGSRAKSNFCSAVDVGALNEDNIENSSFDHPIINGERTSSQRRGYRQNSVSFPRVKREAKFLDTQFHGPPRLINLIIGLPKIKRVFPPSDPPIHPL